MLGLIGINLPQASTVARNVDALYNFILWTCILSFIIIVAGMLYFIFRYRRKTEHDRTAYIEGHTPTELAVIGILFVWVMVIFAWGYIDYRKMIHAPDGALEINVIGRQWMWEFQYQNGKKTLNEIRVPLGKPVKLIMTSSDVLHSFYIPNFRMKQDVVPGMYTTLWFQATETGRQQVFCAEYCGTSHSKMLADLIVMEPKEFDNWLEGWTPEVTGGSVNVSSEQREREGEKFSDPSGFASGERIDTRAPIIDPVARGKELFQSKGCAACHSLTGAPLVGPSMLGLFGKEEELADGTKIKADENYIRESLMEPQAKLVKGFAPVMPTFKGQMTEEEVNALLAFIRSLKP